MSTQLIVYPQNYRGRYNSFSFPSTQQHIVNGISFAGLGATTLHNTTANSPSQDAILNSPASILGAWYRYTTTGGIWGNVPAPVVTSNNLVLSYNAAIGHTGIYQKISGLPIGGIFDVVINIDTAAGGAADLLTIELYSGNVLQYNQQFGTNFVQITTSFTATSSTEIFLIDYQSVVGDLIIKDISIMASPETPSLIYTDLEDGQVICDLYAEEDIPLSLSIDNFKNVAEQVKSYSKDFNLPATKRNNLIFNNMFEITRSYDGMTFNPYRKTKSVLKQDGFIVFEGYLRLIDVKEQDGEISYNVNLYSDMIALADTLKDLTFSDLDFSELEHDYTRDTIEASWEGTGAGQGLPLLSALPNSSFAYDAVTGVNNTQVLKYPFIDWEHQYIMGSNGWPRLKSLESVFRPCIQLKYLINKIFAPSGFNWTSNFFDSTDFEQLFMDFNWGEGNAPVDFTTAGCGNTNEGDPANYAPNGSFANILFPHDCNPAWNWSTESGYDATTGVFTVLQDNTTHDVGSKIMIHFGFNVATVWVEWVSVDAVTGALTIHMQDNYTRLSGSGAYTFNMNFVATLNTGDTLFPRFKSDVTNIVKQYNGDQGELWANVSSDVFTTGTLLQTLRGELGQWDFLKGIMTMFNLVSMVDDSDPNNILIEPYSDIFINNPNSTELDWTEKIDISKMELTPLTDLNSNTIFKFVEDDDDYAFNVFKNSTSGNLYGSKAYPPIGSALSAFTILEGTKEIIAEPFAATVCKPLMSQFPLFVVPALYSMTDAGTSEAFDNSPRIFYNNKKKDPSMSYYIPTQNGVTGGWEPYYLQFSHLSSLPPGVISPTRKDFVFESKQLIGLGTPPVDNLFNTYWLSYFNELYNPNTRTMTIKVNLSPGDINRFKFYDTVFIKNRTFRVNKINYKPNELATVEFILIP
tara:strand:- start:468 stop:3218 length:2751 start_codon:yes stop_codon:yes gene_type:complete